MVTVSDVDGEDDGDMAVTYRYWDYPKAVDSSDLLPPQGSLMTANHPISSDQSIPRPGESPGTAVSPDSWGSSPVLRVSETNGIGPVTPVTGMLPGHEGSPHVL